MKIALHIKTLVLVAITLFFTLQKGNGFVLLILLPVFAVVVLYNVLRMSRKPGERKSRLVGASIWIATLTLAGAVQIFWSAASRADADRVVFAVLDYRDRTGSYPADLEMLGFDEQALLNEWQIRYWLREDKAMLAYPAPFMPLTLYEYDFDAYKWRRNAY